MNIDALLEDYMNNPKWAGKIFMQDEKTCYIDGLIAGAKEMQKENEQLKQLTQAVYNCSRCACHYCYNNDCVVNKYHT